ncbi:FecR family protein [Bacteroides sp. 51]|uniref:FecR family protein n=1 Tax=Bacteroides sp. 51 TaxID=2302938 RepID=UPI0013D21D4F|nr:FecR domain-containing protein [Bacteroides sp. 51]NDV84153.1 DUF4974 domain-containing protein [Bacteroides sp. 51]
MDKDYIIKYFTGELTPKERVELLQAIEEDESLKEEFNAYRNLNGLMALSGTQRDQEEGSASYKLFLAQKRGNRLRRLYTKIAQYAAIATLLIAGSWMAAYFYYDYNALNSIQYNTLSVPAGQHAMLTLSDGTEIWMNARSSIRYPSQFNRETREVELQGEAYFKVTRNTEHPFIVSTPSLRVNVLGTTFNIKCDENKASTDVSLLEGSVEVGFTGNSRKIRLKPMQNLNLGDGKVKITRLENENDFLWKQGILFFDKVPLSEIAKKIEWHYDTKVIIANEKIGEQIYSGKFRQQDGPYEILRILQKTNGFKLKKDDVNNIIEII